MTKPLTKQSIIRTFKDGIKEAEQVAALGGYVVCYAKDKTPFRTDGRIIALYGGKIWRTNNGALAANTARTLDTKAVQATEGREHVISMWAEDWCKQRSELLRNMIDEMMAPSRP